MIIHPFILLPPLLTCGVCKRTGSRLQKDVLRTFNMQEVNVTVMKFEDVCLTRYGDAIVVRVGDQEPPLQFINANAAGPSRQRSKHCALYVGFHSQISTVY